jgi:hypothetical protein
MGRPRKKPAFLVEADVRKSSKLADLSSDTARLGFFYAVLGEAKTSLPIPGRFTSLNHFRELAGRYAEFTTEYIRSGILEVAPRVCERCVKAWSAMPLRSGEVTVHDWHDHQYDPRKVERQRDYEERQRRAQANVSDGVSDAISDAIGEDSREEFPTPFPTPDSRASRTRRAGLNVERGTKNGSSPDGRGSKNRDSPAPPERADVAALLEAGFRRVTPKQRTVLDEIADRHRRRGDDGSWFAVEQIAGRGEPDPLRAVIAADKAEQADNRRRVEDEESIWAATKERDRREAEAVMAGTR